MYFKSNWSQNKLYFTSIFCLLQTTGLLPYFCFLQNRSDDVCFLSLITTKPTRAFYNSTETHRRSVPDSEKWQQQKYHTNSDKRIRSTQLWLSLLLNRHIAYSRCSLKVTEHAFCDFLSWLYCLHSSMNTCIWKV